MGTGGILDAGSPLPVRPRRILVAGTAGAGKSYLAARAAARLDLPYTEIDALFHGPGWTPRPSFVADVEALAAGDGWVTEWQYRAVRSLLADRADLLVWLDPGRARVMGQVVARTVRRRVRRERLWNGNVEPPLHTFFTDDAHIVRWAWSTYARNRRLVADLRRRRPDLVVVRLRTRADVRRWLAGPLTDAAARPRLLG